MKAAVYRVPGRSHEDHLVSMAKGLTNHGIVVDYFSSAPCRDADIAVTWSWRVGLEVRKVFSGPILVMERGFIGDRFNWTSLGWDGLNGRARFTKVDDASRFKKNFGHLLKPWKRKTSGYALVCGQVAGDAALTGVDIHQWYRTTSVALYKQGWDVKFRQHPVEVQRGVAVPGVPFAEVVKGSLDDALSGAGLVITYNSNTGVDAILSGVPVHAADAGSMVYDLSSRDFVPIKPKRQKRLHEMAWCQWQLDEIKSGAAWEVVRESMAR